MANNAVYTRIGRQGADTALIDLGASGKADSDLYSTPGANATWTKFTSATEAVQVTATAAAGYIVLKVNGALGRIPYFLTT